MLATSLLTVHMATGRTSLLSSGSECFLLPFGHMLCSASPNRFKGRRPEPHPVPTAAWINPPPSEVTSRKSPQPCAVNARRSVGQSH